MESLGTSPGALPSGGLVFQLVCRFHRYWAQSSQCTVCPELECSFQDGACSVCFLLQWESCTQRFRVCAGVNERPAMEEMQGGGLAGRQLGGSPPLPASALLLTEPV